MTGTIIVNAGLDGAMLKFEAPVRRIAAETAEQVLPALASLQDALEHGLYLAGWFGYELGAVLAGKKLRSTNAAKLPLLWFGVYAQPTPITRASLNARGRAYAGVLQPEWDRDTYGGKFACVQAHIGAGDIYQANLSFRSRFRFVGDPLALYLQFWDCAKVPYAAYVDTGGLQVLSLSPELFFEISNGSIRTEPMKGTVGRYDSPGDDLEAQRRLVHSDKDRAENIMIVDLMRNDLGRVARAGSVRTSDLCSIRSYPTLHTMVSTVTAQLHPDICVSELIGSLFPAGSITGTPKLRAMQILESLETSERGPYCGAIGYFAPGGGASFNVAIRTAWLNGTIGTTGVGGGVVADSQSDEEYAECVLKAQWYDKGRRPIGLIETLLWDRGFRRVDRHLARMQRSAHIFGLPFEHSAAMAALSAGVARCTHIARVRLELTERGNFLCHTERLQSPSETWRLRLSPMRLYSGDVLLAHKTTWRDLYDDEWQRWCASGDFDEVIFLNERGEVAEGSRTNVFVRADGSLMTPPCEAGLLPGVLRAELLDRAQCIERTLKLEDLWETDELYVGSSLRGLIRARLDRS